MSTLSPSEWHNRFRLQSQWTKDLRTYLFDRISIGNMQAVLEVGCGTGAILSELPRRVPLRAGLDIDREYLSLATRNPPHAKLTQGDGHQLPYSDQTFDVCLCHFLLLWVADPLQVLGEMVRVTRSGGVVMALAEPDYGGRLDYPDELSTLGEWQNQSLQSQGADPALGRKLASLFHKSGLQSVETGVLGGQWSHTLDRDQWESEWKVLESDLSQELLDTTFSENFERLRELDRSAYKNGERTLFVPTFYAMGKRLKK